MRVGELVKLNRTDINFNERSCIVFGKGSSEREVYFDARTKIHLWQYLNSRTDDNPALFVSLRSPHKRLEIGGVEFLLRKLGRIAAIENVHPHRFRQGDPPESVPCFPRWKKGMLESNLRSGAQHPGTHGPHRSPG